MRGKKRESSHRAVWLSGSWNATHTHNKERDDCDDLDISGRYIRGDCVKREGRKKNKRRIYLSLLFFYTCE